MLLTGKNAVIYGGGGTHRRRRGARLRARRAPNVFLAGRTLETLEGRRGRDRRATAPSSTRSTRRRSTRHAAAVGRIDISFNLINHNDVQGTPMAEMAVDDYLAPVVTAVRTHFLTPAGRGPPWSAAA